MSTTSEPVTTPQEENHEQVDEMSHHPPSEDHKHTRKVRTPEPLPDDRDALIAPTIDALEQDRGITDRYGWRP